MAMAYAALANRGISYYPRLVKKVLNQDGTPALDEEGKIAVPDQPKVHADFRTEISPADIELERHGFWNVVNADGGTGSKARLSGVQVAGKTGTAQAKYKGRQDTISWFVCWAPFDNPKYTIAVMVQGGEHGGSVACPIAARIMERSLAMDEGKFEAQVAWLPPAHKANPFQMIKDVSFKDSGINEGGSDDENSNDSQGADVQMAGAGGDPDVEPEADSQGRVARRAAASSARAVQVAAPQQQRPRNFFERLFGVKRQPPPPPPPPPSRKQRTTTR
jgi:membrane peptidoglycan carboxypeptidase